jgi:uncharacterized membrane protein
MYSDKYAISNGLIFTHSWTVVISLSSFDPNKHKCVYIYISYIVLAIEATMVVKLTWLKYHEYTYLPT